MPDYFFMTPRDKAKFFHSLNTNYREQIKPSEPPGSAPKKKTINFKIRFEVKPFCETDRVDSLGKTKSECELYRAEKPNQKWTPTHRSG